MSMKKKDIRDFVENSGLKELIPVDIYTATGKSKIYTDDEIQKLSQAEEENLVLIPIYNYKGTSIRVSMRPISKVLSEENLIF